jgi:hypothetical protein
MQERRKQSRKDLMSYSQVYDLHEGRLIGYLGDLNLLGGMIIADQPVQPGVDLMISIELPELPDIHETSMALSARVVWCHQDISPSYYNIGMEFKNVADRYKTIIEAVIENYEFRRQAPNYPLHPSELEEGN